MWLFGKKREPKDTSSAPASPDAIGAAAHLDILDEEEKKRQVFDQEAAIRSNPLSQFYDL